MKLLKKDRSKLYAVLDNLQRGRAFILEDRTVVTVKTSMGSTDVFTAPFYPDEGLHKINKDIGSPLACLWTGIHTLEKLLNKEG
jgi:hypothetical protein